MKIRNIISICFSVLALSACDKLYDTDRVGQVIRFGASSGEDILTRTQYGETIDGGRQLIQWMDSDEVSIHMFWDGPDGEDGEFMDYGVEHYEDDGVISKARLKSLGSSLLWHGYFKDGKAHEYEHSFYSTYPNVGKNGFVKNEKKFHFSLPSTVEQPVDMRYAFMAAAKENVTSTEDVPVFLQYYPMVTTLYVTFQNDTESAIINEEVLLSGTVPIVGDYDIVYTGNLSQVSETGTSGGTELSAVVSIPTGGYTTVAFFIRPRVYAANSLTFTIHGKEHSLNTILLPAYKYNITVRLGGGVTIDDGLAQLIFGLLLKGDHNTCWSTFGDYLQNYFHYNNCDPDFLNGLYRDLEKMKNAPLDGMAAKLNELFPGDKLSGLLGVLGSLTEIDNVGNGPKLTAKSLDLSIFKSAQKIHLKLEQNTGATMPISVSGLDYLTTIEITDGTSQKIDLTVTDCKLLSKITIGQNEELQNLKLIRTPVFKEATINNQNRDVVSIELNDCSTKADNATINIAGNKNNDPTIKRSGNTANVTVYWGNGKSNP